MGHDWLFNNIKARKLSYFGHLKRHDSLERHILEARLEGKRRKGRPRRRWTEDIKKWLPMSPTEAGREAQKRDVFRRMVREATSTQTCQDDDDDDVVFRISPKSGLAHFCLKATDFDTEFVLEACQLLSFPLTIKQTQLTSIHNQCLNNSSLYTKDFISL